MGGLGRKDSGVVLVGEAAHPALSTAALKLVALHSLVSQSDKKTYSLPILSLRNQRGLRPY